MILKLRDFFTFSPQGNLIGWSIFLALFALGFFGLGYVLMAKQVKLVKSEIWTWRDVVKCLMYAFMFSAATTLIGAMIVSYSSRFFGPDPATPNMDMQQTAGPYLVFPLFFCLIFLLVYPLIEFLNMANTKEEQASTPIQMFLERNIIKKFKAPLSYVVAVGLYFILILLPPIIITPLLPDGVGIIAWISWALIIPMGTITFFGSKGFLTGFISEHYRLPNLKRSMMLGFEDSKRAIKEFTEDPLPRIVYPLRYLIIFTTSYSLIRTLGRLTAEGGLDSPSNISFYQFTTYLTLIFGLIGYFTRFWGRSVKFRTMDLFFAAYLVAAVGINVLLNFMMSNTVLLETALDQWNVTSGLTGTRAPDGSKANAVYLAYAAVIEEIGMLSYSIYFATKTRKKGFFRDVQNSILTKSAENFDPIAPFNFIRSDEVDLRTRAEKILYQMYDRIPGKRGYALIDSKFKCPLLDNFCDTDPHASLFTENLVTYLVSSYPKNMLPLVKEAISSPNLEKKTRMLQILTKDTGDIVSLLDFNEIYLLLLHPDFEAQTLTLQLLNRIYQVTPFSPSSEQISKIVGLLDHPAYDLQAAALELLGNFPDAVPENIFSSRLEHPSAKIRIIAAGSVGSIDLDNLSVTAFPKLVKMLDNPSIETRASVMKAIAHIGNFAENIIPLDKFHAALYEQNENLRNAAKDVIIQVIREKPEDYDFGPLFDSFPPQSSAIQATLLQILGISWKKHYDRLFPLMVDSLKSSDSGLKAISEGLFIEISKTQLVDTIEKLLPVKDTESFVKKGAVSSLISKIGECNPQQVVPLLLKALEDERPGMRLNAANSLSRIVSKSANLILPDKFMNLWKNADEVRLKRELSQVLVALVKNSPDRMKPYVKDITAEIGDSDSKNRLIISKLLVDLAEKNSDAIDFEPVVLLTEDSDSHVRENGLKLIGKIGQNHATKAMEILTTKLNDKEWNVKKAAASGIAVLSQNADEKEIMSIVKKLLNDSSKWTRAAGLEVLEKIVENNPSILTSVDYEKLVNRTDNDEKFRANLAKIVGLSAADNLDPYFPLVLKLLQDSDEAVRKNMISGMVKIAGKQSSSEFIPKLLFYLSDETDLRLQQSIALVLRRIAKYESKPLKTRVISMLKIRAAVSQDPIISQALTDLQG